ncbi:MAG: hypothetical protein LIO77_08970 [Rikenellaceae bacterium]|nr:hypothetical protein [Rikenellaceae bacterium]
MRMSTTTLIVEYLMSGIFGLISIAVLFFTCFPDLFCELSSKHELGLGSSAILLLMILSVAYSLGIAIETISLSIFEKWIFKRLPVGRMTRWIETKPILKKDPLFKGMKAGPKLNEVRSCYGHCRFKILECNQELYGEIESQISRMRLIRVLCIFESLIWIASLIFLIRIWACQDRWNAWKGPIIFAFIGVTVITALTYWARKPAMSAIFARSNGLIIIVSGKKKIQRRSNRINKNYTVMITTELIKELMRRQDSLRRHL